MTTLSKALASIAVVVLALGCGPPVLDTSSVPAFVDSAEELRQSLDPEQQAAFDDAFDYFTDHAYLGSDAAYLEPVLNQCAPIDGMTGEEIILQAWKSRIEALQSHIADLELRRERSRADREILDQIELADAKLYPAQPGFLDHAVVEAEVRNRCRRRIYEVVIRASLRQQNEVETEIVEQVGRSFGSGLKPGDEATIRLELSADEWSRASELGSQGVFVCDLARIEGRNHAIIAESEFGALEKSILDELHRRLDELQAAKPDFH